MGERVRKARDEKKFGRVPLFETREPIARFPRFIRVKQIRAGKQKQESEKEGEESEKEVSRSLVTAATGIVGADSSGTRRGRDLSR